MHREWGRWDIFFFVETGKLNAGEYLEGGKFSAWNSCTSFQRGCTGAFFRGPERDLGGEAKLFFYISIPVSSLWRQSHPPKSLTHTQTCTHTNIPSKSYRTQWYTYIVLPREPILSHKPQKKKQVAKITHFFLHCIVLQYIVHKWVVMRERHQVLRQFSDNKWWDNILLCTVMWVWGRTWDSAFFGQNFPLPCLYRPPC